MTANPAAIGGGQRAEDRFRKLVHVRACCGGRTICGPARQEVLELPPVRCGIKALC